MYRNLINCWLSYMGQRSFVPSKGCFTLNVTFSKCFARKNSHLAPVQLAEVCLVVLCCIALCCVVTMGCVTRAELPPSVTSLRGRYFLCSHPPGAFCDSADAGVCQHGQPNSPSVPRATLRACFSAFPGNAAAAQVSSVA